MKSQSIITFLESILQGAAVQSEYGTVERFPLDRQTQNHAIWRGCCWRDKCQMFKHVSQVIFRMWTPHGGIHSDNKCLKEQSAALNMLSLTSETQDNYKTPLSSHLSNLCVCVGAAILCCQRIKMLFLNVQCDILSVWCSRLFSK